ncbi:BspA family leucine-rich repeat surface protein, partial [Candidatus Saccharibacteria bacterium]|nr:BspA family leucine-rich repeat surface protein [Candidatus Saccharibacteria bacterium]
NLRLDTAGTVGYNTIDPTVTNESLAQGYAKYSGTGTNYGSFAGLANPETSNFSDESYTANSLYSYNGSNNTININSVDSPPERMPRYNNNNTRSRASNATGTGNTYSYGNYYSWAAAIADTSYYSQANQSATQTSLCPAGWHLPVGGDSTNAENSDYWQLGVSIMGVTPTNNSYYQSTERNPSGDTASKAFRKYPNNFIYSGYYSGSSAGHRNTNGYYQSSTNYRRFRMNNSYVYPGTNDSGKYIGNAIRCLISEPYHRVPVTMDSHVSSVVITNSSDPSDTQTVTTSGETAFLYEDTSYIITAAINTGYELGSWSTDENGILGSTTANPSTFAIIGDTVLSATSQERPVYNTTVNFDSGVSNVTFYNAEYGTHYVAISGGTVPLSRNIEYTVTTTMNNGYKFNSWSTDEGGSLVSTKTNPTTFVVTAPATLSATTVSVPALTCTKQYRLQNADGTYPDTYISDGSELVSYNGTCSYSKTVENYETKTMSKTVLNDTTISLDLPRSKYTLTVEYDDSTISGVIGEGDYRWGQEVRIAAYPSSGKYFTNWSQTAGTTSSFGDPDISNTTFIVPIGGATVYASGGSMTYPYYVVTVNMDEHVTSVRFESDECVSEEATVSGETIDLCGSTTYHVSSSYVNGYTTDYWATTPNGTLGGVNTPRTTYSVVGNSTLTLTSTTRKTTTLLPGRDLSRLMKTLAEGGSYSYDQPSSKIKAVRMANSLPTGVTRYTVSTSDSEYPVYIFFDNTNDAGIMYFYTEANDIYMNEDSNSAFYSNTALSDISALSSWNTSKVTLMYGMFRDNTSLTNIDALANWDTSNVTSMAAMFSGDTALSNIEGARNWDTGSATNLSMFSYTAITNIDALVNWNTSSVTTMESMFYSATSLTNIDGAINWNTSNVTTMESMFYGAASLTNIDGAAKWDTGNVRSMEQMFGRCVYSDDDYPGATSFCVSSLTNIDGATNWNTSNVTTMKNMFKNSTSLTNINGALNWDTSKVTDMTQMFQNTVSLTNIDGAINWDTGNVTTMKSLFAGYYGNGTVRSSLANIDGVLNWDTSKVTDMRYMFWGTASLTNINGAANWNTGSVTTMEGMFRYSKIYNIDGASSWDTSNVKNMSAMFWWTQIDSIDALANWDVGSVTNMNSMFYDTALTNIDGAINWDTSNVANMAQMFMFAVLTNVNGAANWNTGRVWDMHYMFFCNYIADASAINDWDISNVQARAGSSDMENNKFFRMFGHDAYSQDPQGHPDFTRRAGTWNSEGTFIPSETAASQQSNSVSPTSVSLYAAPTSASQILDAPNTDSADPTSDPTADSTDPSYTSPQGSRRAKEQDGTDVNDGTLGVTLAVAAVAAVTSSTAFFVVTRSRKEDE